MISDRMRIRMALVIVPFAVIGLFARNLYSQMPTPVELIEAPRAWIPFSADVTVTHPQSAKVVGRFYRATDGSQRLESGPSLDDIRVIDIKNVGDRLRYTFSRRNAPGTPSVLAWTREPLDLPNGGLPEQWRKGLANWFPHPYRLAIRRGESGSVTATEGYEAFRVTTNTGILHLKIPALNFFDAVIQRPDGRHEVYTNIEVGEPAFELFRPPNDAVVTDRPPRPVAANGHSHGQHGDHGAVRPTIEPSGL